jgi:hypothetical protein
MIVFKKNLIQLILSFITDEKVIIILTSISIISLILSIFLIPYIIINIPENYFIAKKRICKKGGLFIISRLLKNIFGFLLILLGFVMLFTPGQGIICLLAGFILLNFPGKYKLEKKLILNKKIYTTINKIRKKHNHPPITLDE